MQVTNAAPKQNLGALTGVRFIAAMAVYFYHFGAGFMERLGAPFPIVNILKNGYVGVSVFFVLSGFILYYTYQGSVERFGDYKRFLEARFARVYPVYLLVLLVALPVTTRPTDSESVFRVLTMTQSWTLPASDLGFAWVTQAWTLSVELFFYLLFPLYAAAIARMPTSLIIPACVTVSVFIVVGGLSTITPSTVGADVHPIIYQLPIPLLRTLEFVFGILLCRVFLGARLYSQSSFFRTPCVLVVVALLLAILSISTERFFVAVATVVSGLLLIQLAVGNSQIARLLATKWMVLAGGASYALYLLQGPVHDYVKKFDFGSLAPIVQLIACCVLSVAVYKWYEEPVRKIIKSRL